MYNSVRLKKKKGLQSENQDVTVAGTGRESGIERKRQVQLVRGREKERETGADRD